MEFTLLSYAQGKLPKSAKSTVFMLIPKKATRAKLDDFWLISFIEGFKRFSLKCWLVAMLRKVSHKVIRETQSVFIEGREN